MCRYLPYCHLPYYILFFHILTNTKFIHATSTYYHRWYLVFEFTFNVTYCTRLYLVYQTLNTLFSVATGTTLNLNFCTSCHRELHGMWTNGKPPSGNILTSHFLHIVSCLVFVYLHLSNGCGCGKWMRPQVAHSHWPNLTSTWPVEGSSKLENPC